MNGRYDVYFLTTLTRGKDRLKILLFGLCICYKQCFNCDMIERTLTKRLNRNRP